jgi:multiple sugar transport system permease protein
MYIGGKVQKRIVISTFLLPSFIGMFCFILIPLVITVVMSTTDYDVLQHTLPKILAGQGPDFVGLENYKDLLTSGSMWAAFSHTLYYMALYIPAVIVLALFLAVLLNREFAGAHIYRTIFYLPVVSSWVAVSVVWLFFLNGKFGLMNSILSLIGIDGPAWVTDRKWVFPGIAMTAVWKDVGYFTLIFLAGLKSINHTYYEAARVDGSNRWQEFTRITLPLLTPSIFLVLIMLIIGTFQVFESVAIMGASLRSYTTVMVTTIYNYAFRTYRMGDAMALSVILFLVLVGITLFQFTLQKRWVYYDE